MGGWHEIKILYIERAETCVQGWGRCSLTTSPSPPSPRGAGWERPFWRSSPENSGPNPSRNMWVQGPGQSEICESRAKANQEYMSPGPRPIRNMWVQVPGQSGICESRSQANQDIRFVQGPTVVAGPCESGPSPSSRKLWIQGPTFKQDM
jgi:hypothetical protein